MPTGGSGSRATSATLLALATALGGPGVASSAEVRLEKHADPVVFRPLDEVAVQTAGEGVVSVTDGEGHEYVRRPAPGRVTFVAGAAAGTHTVRLLGADGEIESSARFRLEPQTEIRDGSGRMHDLLGIARSTMQRWLPSLDEGVGVLDWRGETYRYYVHWLRDHVHTLKGMKYFDGTGGEIIDVFRVSQRDDGMIWDNFRPWDRPGNFFQNAYGPHGYADRIDGLQFVRMPVEADVEYLFVEGIYFAWKMSGDDAWMARQLDAAIRALDYSASDPARWSETYGLVKRAYTIDTWDFQFDDEWTELFPRWSTLLIDPARTQFGIMFGDDTGYAASCGYLAEMLDRVGRPSDAARFRAREDQIRTRLDEVSWLGAHFQHWVPEDPSIVRDGGVDPKAQVSLSNTYSLNRGIADDEAAAIIHTYQGIRDDLPPGSPGEWYGIYPPFKKGFEGHAEPWEYVNGGVSPIFGGELARGAFAHGFESYGADILSRILDLAKAHGDRVAFAYTGAYFPPSEPTYTEIDLSPWATMDLGGEGAEGVPGWMAALPDDNMAELPTGRQVFGGIPFLVTDPMANGRRAVVAVSRRDDLPERVEVPIGADVGSLYVVHTTGENGNTKQAGALTFLYEDGTDAVQYLVRDSNVAHWWYPGGFKGAWPEGFGQPKQPPLVKLAWKGKSEACTSVGLYWYGLNNPHPERPVRAVAFSSTLDGAIYAVVGLTLSDRPIDQPLPPVSYGGPDNWAAAAVVYGLVEGLAGVVDEDVTYRVAGVAPRWAATGTDEARVVVHYPASDGYVAYDYDHDPAAREIVLTVTGSGQTARCHVLLPAGIEAAASVRVDDGPETFTTSRLQASAYADFDVSLPGPRTVRIRY